MKLVLFVFSLLLISPDYINAQFKDLFKKAKSEILGEEDIDIGLGLKEALERGTEEAVDKLSAENGYLSSTYKILLPQEAQKVTSKLKLVPGFQDVELQLIEKMNEAAEHAAKEASPIFISAIQDMTFEDAMNILMGEENEATMYLENTTKKKLYTAFLPIIQKALDEVNARTYWKTAVQTYNEIPFTRDVNPELDDHVNKKALEGMFGYIAVKEKGIRNDLGQRNSPLLKKVFAKQDKKK